MISPLKSVQLAQPILEKRDLAEYGIARFRDQVFDAVQMLWRRRKKEGWTQKRLAESIGRDPGWVSTNLRAPGNWTLLTAGELIQGLHGEAEIRVAALEDPIETPTNYDAYDGYLPSQKQNVIGTMNFVGTISVENPMAANISINQSGGYEIKMFGTMLSIPGKV